MANKKENWTIYLTLAIKKKQKKNTVTLFNVTAES